MIRPRWRKVLADLLGNKLRSLMVIASIAVGLFAIGMISGLHSMLGEDMPASYAAANPANIQVRAVSISPDFIDHIARMPGIHQAEGAAIVDLRLKVAENEYIPISIKAVKNFEHMEIARVTVLEGTWPPKDHEIAIDVNRLEDTHASLGEMVEIALPSGKTRSLRVVAIVRDQTIGSESGASGFFRAPSQGYINFNTLGWLEKPGTMNLLLATVDEQPDDMAHVQEMTTRVLQEFDDAGIVMLNSAARRASDHPNKTLLDAMAGVLFLLGFLVVFLSGFLITNTLSALLNQQVEHIGVMKTIGAERRQIIGIYMVLILAYSLIALLIAVPLANLAAFAELRYLAGSINFLPQGRRVVPEAILLQIGIALLVPQLAGAIPILQGTRASIQQALSGSGPSEEGRHGRFYRWLAHLRGLSRPLLISLRNTFRRRLRLSLTLLTLVLGGSIFIGTFNVRTSLDHYITRLGRYFLADVNLTFAQPYRVNEVEQTCREVEGVRTVEAWATARAELIGENDTPGETVALLAPPADSELIDPMIISGRWIAPGDQNAIVLSELFLDQYPNLNIGDTLYMKVAGEKTDWVVVGFFQLAGKNTGLAAYTRYEYLARLAHTPNKAYLYRIVADGGPLTLEGQKDLVRRLEDHLNEQGFQISDASAGNSLLQYTAEGLDTLTTFLLIMALLMAIVGSIGLTGTMSLNVMERTREIGVMRAIGANNRAIMNLVIVESMIISLISWALSCVASLPISLAMSNIISAAIFSKPIPFTFTPLGLGIWLALMLLLSLAASVLPARSAARLTIREVLAYE